MKTMIGRILIALSLLFCSQILLAQKADDVLGIWLNQEKDAKIEIYKQGGKYSGKISWLKEPLEIDGKTPKLDKNNPEEGLRTRKIEGLVILKDLFFEDGEWDNGEIYDPRSGNTYTAKFTLVGEQLEIRGYMGVSWLGRSTTWTRPE